MQSLSRTIAVLFGFVLLIGAEVATAQGRRRAMRSGPPADAVTSFDVIDRAAAEGRISPDQAMLYKVFSIYGDSRLPQEMRGDDDGLADSLFMSEVAAKYESLPVDVQQQVAPFLIPPFHQNSWWELRHNQNTSPYASNDVRSFGIGITRPCTDCPLSFDWEFIPTANGKAKVWYYGSDAASEAKAKAFAAEIDSVIWPKLKALMGREPMPDDGDGWLGASLGGDSKLDIALVDIERSVTTGRYPNKCESAAWSYIQFEKTKGKEELAHELMHSFQYAFNVQVRGANCTGENEYRWLMESTAEWVKDHIYPNAPFPVSEHPYAPAYLQEPEKPLNFAEDPHWYGAYLLPFFLDRIKGQSTIVGEVWRNTEGASSLDAYEQALQSMGGFEKVWPEFVVHNWNRDPVDNYEKLDQLTAKPKALGETLLTNGVVDKYASLNFQLHHLTSSYKHFVFNDNVNSFAFINGVTYNISTEPRMLLNTWDLGHQYKWEEVPAAQKKGASVQAILKRNGKWEQPLDWTNVAYKPFCRQKPEEKIEEIVLIFANGNHDESSVLTPAGMAPQLIVTDMGCRFEGELDWDSSAVTIQGAGNIDLQYKNTFEPRDPMETISQFLGYYYDASGHASWSVTGSVGPCGTGKTVPHAPIRTDLLQFSMNFAPKTSTGYRKGYFQLHMTEPMRYSLHCPVADVPLEHYFIFFPAISFDPTMYLNTAPGGGMKDSTSNPLGSWEWDYKLKK